MFTDPINKSSWECPEVIRTESEYRRVKVQRVWLRKARKFFQTQVQLHTGSFTEDRMTALDLEIAEVEARLRTYAKAVGYGFAPPDAGLRTARRTDGGVGPPEARINNSDALTELCRSLIKKRVRRGLRQADVAHAIGISPAQFSRYERHYYAQATIGRIRQIMRLFGDSVK